MEPWWNPGGTLPQGRPGPPRTLSGLRPHSFQLLGNNKPGFERSPLCIWFSFARKFTRVRRRFCGSTFAKPDSSLSEPGFSGSDRETTGCSIPLFFRERVTPRQTDSSSPTPKVAPNHKIREKSLAPARKGKAHMLDQRAWHLGTRSFLHFLGEARLFILRLGDCARDTQTNIYTFIHIL